MDPLTLRRRFDALAGAPQTIPVEVALALFDDLPAVELDEMVGEWAGEVVDTGHPCQRCLAELAWAGKLVRSDNDVEPLICRDRDGRRVASRFWGTASLRRVEFREVVTATAIYAQRPTLEHFRRVDAGLLLGAMDFLDDRPPLVFGLHRL